MKRSTLIISIALIALLGVYTTSANASTTKSIELYTVKKVHRNYKVTKAAKTLASKVKTFGKEHKYNGKTYYYVSNLHKYTDQAGYKAVNKYYDQKAKAQSDEFSKKYKTHNTNNDNNANTTTAKVVNGYDETNQKIVDMSTFTNVLAQTAFNKLNDFRKSQGLSPLTLDSDMSKVAQIRAQQVSQFNGPVDDQTAHFASDGTLLSLLAAQQLGLPDAQHYETSVAENVGQAWMSGLDKTTDMGNYMIQTEINEGPNGGHYQNDDNPSYTKCGIGFYVEQSTGDVGYALELQ